MNEDFLDLLSALSDAKARFLIVGAYAVGLHGHPRATKDLDIWIEATLENAQKVFSALQAFGAPVGDLKEGDLSELGTGFMMGIPPRRIDLLTQISGVSFEVAWPRRVEASVSPTLRCPFIGLEDLIENKRAADRPQDRVDVTILERLKK